MESKAPQEQDARPLTTASSSEQRAGRQAPKRAHVRKSNAAAHSPAANARQAPPDTERQKVPVARRPNRRGHNSRAPAGRRTLQQRIGQRAEDIAADFLQAKGLQILERNFRRRLGELDIVALDGDDVLVIAEVRSRASNRYGGAAASVDGRKQQRLVRAATQLLQRRSDFSHFRVRFDVICVSEIGAATPRVEWFQHAFLT